MAGTVVIKKELSSLRRLRNEVPKQAYKIIHELNEKILDYVREKQLFEKGIDGKGNLLKPYTPFTIAMKKLKGEVYNRTTLLDTEDFYKAFYLEASNMEITIWSRDIKTEKLVEKYGKDIFLLTPDHNYEVNEKLIKPRLIEWLINSIEI